MSQLLNMLREMKGDTLLELGIQKMLKEGRQYKLLMELKQMAEQAPEQTKQYFGIAFYQAIKKELCTNPSQ